VIILGESLHIVYFYRLGYTESVRNATGQLYYVEVECVVHNSNINSNTSTFYFFFKDFDTYI